MHLRLASRVSPPTRRAFHLWTLGTVLYFSGRYAEAIGALSRAARWGTTDKPLYRGQLVLARLSAGEPANTAGQVGAARERLEESACGQGYGQFVLGELALSRRRLARRGALPHGVLASHDAGEGGARRWPSPPRSRARGGCSAKSASKGDGAPPSSP